MSGRQFALRQIAYVPRYKAADEDYDNDIDIAAQPPDEASNELVPSNTELRIPLRFHIPANTEFRITTKKSPRTLIILPVDNTHSVDTFVIEEASSDNLLREASAAPPERSLSVENVDLLRGKSNDCVVQDDTFCEYRSKLLSSLSNNDEDELIRDLDKFSKYLRSKKVKENARKNIVNGNNNTKHKPKIVALLTQGLQNEGKFSENISDCNICYVVDVMNNLRCMQWKKLKTMTFQNLAEVLCEYIKQKCTNPKRIDFVFDMYPEFSTKSAARVQRYGNTKPIEFSVGAGETLPVDNEKNFWACEKNKIKIQEYIRQFITENYTRYWGNTVVILSATNKETCEVCSTELSDSPENIDCRSLQRHDIEEADDRVILHINHAILCGHDTICILSQDTDIFIGAMYFYWKFKNIGLKTIWMAISGGRERFRPIHEFAEFRGRELCEVLPAMHNLTGAESTKKVGTKYQGLQARPAKFLAGFAHGTSPEEVTIAINLAEEYMIQVVQNGNTSKTFDELSNPPMTSASARQHILRAFFITYNTIHILDAHYSPLDPRLYGYQEINGLLMPIELDDDEENVAAQL